MNSLSIEFLGTGTSQGVPVIACDCEVCVSSDSRDKRLRSSALIRVNEKALLIDAGPDMRQQMLRHEVKRIDAVFLTHEHIDHIAGIDELRAFNFRQKQVMDIYASPATNAAVRRMFHYAFSEERYPGVPELALHDLREGPFTLNGVTVSPFEVMHDKLPVLGYRIADLAYITDAKTIAPYALDILLGLDVLVINALRRKKHPAHLSLDEAIAIAEQVGARRTYFTHVSHLMGRHEHVDQKLPNGMAFAYDGLKVQVETL